MVIFLFSKRWPFFLALSKQVHLIVGDDVSHLAVFLHDVEILLQLPLANVILLFCAIFDKSSSLTAQFL